MNWAGAPIISLTPTSNIVSVRAPYSGPAPALTNLSIRRFGDNVMLASGASATSNNFVYWTVSNVNANLAAGNSVYASNAANTTFTAPSATYLSVTRTNESSANVMFPGFSTVGGNTTVFLNVNGVPNVLSNALLANNTAPITFSNVPIISGTANSYMLASNIPTTYRSVPVSTNTVLWTPAINSSNIVYNTLTLGLSTSVANASYYQAYSNTTYLGQGTTFSNIQIPLNPGQTYTNISVLASKVNGSNTNLYNSAKSVAVAPAGGVTPVTPANATAALATLTPDEALGYYITNTGSNAADVCVGTRTALKEYRGDKVSARNVYLSTLAKKANASIITLPTSNVAGLNNSFVSGSLPTNKPVDVFLTNIATGTVDITSLNTDGTKNTVVELPVDTGVVVKDNGSNVGNLYMQYSITDGAIDPAFTSGVNGTVIAIAVQSDGQILIGSDFTTYNRIARLNADGSLDNSFDVGSGVGSVGMSYVNSIVIQSDGQILIGGLFTAYNGQPRNNIVRLNANGSLDESFNDGSGVNGALTCIAVQSDGKIVIGGLFTTPRNRIARLNADGSLDTTFLNTGTGASATVSSIAIQSDGKILIGGLFTTYNGQSRTRIARLNADGSLDATFVVGTGANDNVRSISLQTDGKILIGGLFTTYNNQSQNCIARLNADGSLDNSFNVGSGANNSVYVISLQTDGKILIGGEFTTYNGTSRNRIARLNADGSLDNSFDVGSGTSNSVRSIELQNDGKILIGGVFTTYNELSAPYIARITSKSDNAIIYPTEDGTGFALTLGTVLTYGQLNLSVDAVGSLGGSGSLSGGGGGDPYVTTMSRASTSYKLPTMNAPIRYYQGMVDGKLLTVNVSLKTIPKSAMMDTEIRDYFRLSKDLNLTAKQRSFLEHSMFKDETLCFFERVYVKHGENSMTMRIFDSKFEVESYTGRIPATLMDDKDSLRRSTGIYGSYAGKTLKLRCGSASVLVSVYDAPIVRNGINVMATLSKESNGVLVNVLSSKDMKLDSLETTTAVPQRDSPVRTITETFTDADGMRSRKIAVAK